MSADTQFSGAHLTPSPLSGSERRRQWATAAPSRTNSHGLVRPLMTNEMKPYINGQTFTRACALSFGHKHTHKYTQTHALLTIVRCSEWRRRRRRRLMGAVAAPFRMLIIGFRSPSSRRRTRAGTQVPLSAAVPNLFNHLAAAVQSLQFKPIRMIERRRQRTSDWC